jgi:branched-chain amino acid transport system substrate-binding protein
MREVRNQKIWLKTLFTTLFILTFFIGQTIASAQDAPIKIGMLIPFSGPTAGTAKDGRLAVEMFLEDVGGKMANRNIELIVEDTAHQPKVGLEKIRKLVESDKVHMVTGVTLSHVALAIRDYVVNHKVPMIITAFAGTAALSFGKKSDYIARTSLVNGIQSLCAAKYACEKLGYKKFVVMGADFVAGREKGKIFEGIVKENGGEVIQKLFTPIGTKDYAPYITKIEDADAMYAFYQPGDGLRFVKQYSGFGKKKEIPIITTAGMVNSVTLPIIGDKAKGIIMSNHLAPIGPFPDRPQYVEFCEKFQKKYGHMPQDGAIQCYNGIQVVKMALEATNGNVEDALGFMKAVKNVKFEAIHSPFRIEPDTNSVSQNVRVVKLVEENGKMGFTTLQIYEDIGATDVAPYLKKR